ncbi:MAG: hypothetical protein LBH54_01665, partial [Clostridiales bacterium]|nr:hypothetical protein [Clostridiales bacterium]
YTVEGYYATGKNVASVVVVYEDDSLVEVDALSPTAIITNITDKSNPDNSDYSKQLSLFVFGRGAVSGVTENRWAEASAVRDFVVGDVIQYTLTSEDYINSDTVELAYGVTGAMETVDKTRSTAGITTQIVSGLLYDADGTRIYLAKKNNMDDMADVAIADAESYGVDGNARVFMYDATKSGTERVVDLENTADPVYDLGNLHQYIDYADAAVKRADELFVYRYEAAVRFIYIVRR